MAIENLFDHTCDIYHLLTDSGNLGYGITADVHNYANTPDIQAIPCHFNVDPDGIMQQTESANEYTYTGKLQLPTGTDIRVNDKVVDRGNNLIYTARVPKNIRNHHMVVAIQRSGTVKGAL
jgi:hypothetical protein